jgi:hypothetical protein
MLLQAFQSPWEKTGYLLNVHKEMLYGSFGKKKEMWISYIKISKNHVQTDKRVFLFIWFSLEV